MLVASSRAKLDAVALNKKNAAGKCVTYIPARRWFDLVFSFPRLPQEQNTCKFSKKW